MSPNTIDLTTTRLALQRLAVHVLARRRHAVTGRFGLRPAPGGLATPAFGDETGGASASMAATSSSSGATTATVAADHDARRCGGARRRRPLRRVLRRRPHATGDGARRAVADRRQPRPHARRLVGVRGRGDRRGDRRERRPRTRRGCSCGRSTSTSPGTSRSTARRSTSAPHRATRSSPRRTSTSVRGPRIVPATRPTGTRRSVRCYGPPICRRMDAAPPPSTSCSRA